MATRPEGYYWVRSTENPDDEPQVARWRRYTIATADGSEGVWIPAEFDLYHGVKDAAFVEIYRITLHCYSRDCLRGSSRCWAAASLVSMAGRQMAETDETLFKAKGCECDCHRCGAARSALSPTKEK